uniref:Uncharacterized protein n=1 Tax=Monodon monoceros TaxID=40151 RepID=A0A8C6B8Q3_MONMO
STGSVVVAQGLSCSAACGIFLDQGSNPCRLHWQCCVLKQVGESAGAFLPHSLHTFLFQEGETKPEDCIPDVPGNEHAREFLAHAPTKGLWMPLGKEVKVMQSWEMNSSGNNDHFEGSNSRRFFYVHPVAQQLHLSPWYQNAVYNPFSIPGAGKESESPKRFSGIRDPPCEPKPEGF